MGATVSASLADLPVVLSGLRLLAVHLDLLLLAAHLDLLLLVECSPACRPLQRRLLVVRLPADLDPSSLVVSNKRRTRAPTRIRLPRYSGRRMLFTVQPALRPNDSPLAFRPILNYKTY